MSQMGLSVRTVGELDDALGPQMRRSLALPEGKDGAARILTAGGHKLALISAQNAAQLVQGVADAQRGGAELVVGLIHDSFEHALAYPAASVAGVNLLVTSHSPGAASGEESRLTRGTVPTAQVQSKGRALLRLDVHFAGEGSFELLKTQADSDKELGALDERIALLKKQIDSPTLRAESKKLYQDKLIDFVRRRERLASTPLPAAEGKNSFAARFVPLEATLPGSPDVLALVQAYDRDVAQLNLAWAKEHGQDCPKPGKNEAGYVGNEACRDCHAEAFAVWDASKHAHAYDDLARAGKNYRVDCIKCHVVGYEQPGGVCRVDKVEERKDVGCESCHGPGSIHSADPTLDNVLRKPEQEICTGCHDVENSPHFDFALYLPEILGPGHGKPAPDAGTPRKPKR
jgi:predicted CXXCH cytochrome family protein